MESFDQDLVILVRTEVAWVKKVGPCQPRLEAIRKFRSLTGKIIGRGGPDDANSLIGKMKNPF
jgi:hypothetical protein